MRRKDNLGALQAKDARVLRQIIVVADQRAHRPAEQFKNIELIALADRGVLEGVDLSMLEGIAPGRRDDDVGVVHLPIGRLFEHSEHHHDVPGRRLFMYFGNGRPRVGVFGQS